MTEAPPPRVFLCVYFLFGNATFKHVTPSVNTILLAESWGLQEYPVGRVHNGNGMPRGEFNTNSTRAVTISRRCVLLIFLLIL